MIKINKNKSRKWLKPAVLRGKNLIFNLCLKRYEFFVIFANI